MPFGKRIKTLLGFSAPDWMRVGVAKRNMLIVAIVSMAVVLFAAMVLLCMLTGIPCPISGFRNAVERNPAMATRFAITCAAIIILMLGLFLYAFMSIRRKWERLRFATVIAVVFAFLIVMLWGMAEAGEEAERQVLIFASIQFLVAGLLIFTPFTSIVYFSATYAVFGTALSLSGLLTDMTVVDLVYLAILDIIVACASYALFWRASRREHELASQSRRDELTGAKNRHCLRSDFEVFVGNRLFVMLCDIDDFKRYNDEYNHTVGDSLLQQFYFALREAFSDDCVYRYGGDEFLIVSPDFSANEFVRKVEKACNQLKTAFVEGVSDVLAFSGGFIHGVAADDEALRNMVHQADEYLLTAKRDGKHRVVGPDLVLDLAEK